MWKVELFPDDENRWVFRSSNTITFLGQSVFLVSGWSNEKEEFIFIGMEHNCTKRWLNRKNINAKTFFVWVWGVNVQKYENGCLRHSVIFGQALAGLFVALARHAVGGEKEEGEDGCTSERDYGGGGSRESRRLSLSDRSNPVRGRRGSWMFRLACIL